MNIFQELQAEGIDSALLDEIRHFRDTHPAPSEASDRVPHPRYL